MKGTEIIEKIEQGEQLIVKFYPRKTIHYISNGPEWMDRITSAQFEKAKNTFGNKLVFSTAGFGVMTHRYALKK